MKTSWNKNPSPSSNLRRAQTQIKIKNKNTEPVFLDNKKRIYDKLYRPIKEKNGKQAELNTQMDFFPLPEKSNSKLEFHTQCLHWRHKIREQLKGLFPAATIVSDLRLPQPPFHVNIGSQQYRRFNPKNESPTSLNYVVMLKLILSGYDFHDEDLFPIQYPNRENLNFIHQLVKASQWQSQLVPQEPYPFLYDKYQDFEEAYRNWKNVCWTLLKLPNRPISFEYKMDVIPKSPIYKMQAQRYAKPQTHDFSWTKRLTFSCTEEQISRLKRLKLSNNNNNNNHLQTYEPDNCITVGPNRSEFLLDFKHYGYHVRSLLINYPLRIYGAIPMEANMSQKILDLFIYHKYSGMSLFLHFLSLPFDSESFKSISHQNTRIRSFSINNKQSPIVNQRQVMSNSINVQSPLLSLATKSNVKTESKQVTNIEDNSSLRPKKRYKTSHTSYMSVMDFLHRYLFPTKIFSALEIIKNNNIYYTRLSMIMPQIISTSYVNDELFSYLRKDRSLNDLNSFVKLMLWYYRPNLSLKPISTRTEFGINVSQLYLYSILLDLNYYIKDMTFIESIRKEAHELTIKIYNNLPKHLNNLWRSFELRCRTEEYKIIQMLIMIPSKMIIKLLLGKDFLKKANKISKFKYGRQFLLSFIYNNNSFIISTVFEIIEPYIDNSFTKFMDMFCSLLFQILNEYLMKYNLCLCGSQLLPFVDQLDFKSFPFIYKYITLILCDPNLISNFSTHVYQNKLANLTLKITNSGAPYLQILTTLLPFTKVERCNILIIENIPFINKMISMLDITPNKEFFMSWELMNSLICFIGSSMKLFSYEQIQKLFLNLANSDNPIVVLQYMSLLMTLWKSNSKQLREKLVQIITPAVGPISCIIQLASVKFQKYQKTQELIMAFCDAVMSSHNSEQLSFKQQLCTHMEYNTNKRKSSRNKI